MIQYDLFSFVSCNLLTATDRATFNASASVSTNCSVSASNLNFGTLGVLNAAINANTTVSPGCANGTPYTIALNGGLSSATQRAASMLSSDSEHASASASPLDVALTLAQMRRRNEKPACQFFLICGPLRF